MFTVTYDVVTPESAEDGDNAESGFVLPGNWLVPIETALADKSGTYTMRLRDAVDLCGNIYDVGSWFDEIDTRENYTTGAHTRYSLHPPRNITRASYARLRRVLSS